MKRLMVMILTLATLLACGPQGGSNGLGKNPQRPDSQQPSPYPASCPMQFGSSGSLGQIAKTAYQMADQCGLTEEDIVRLVSAKYN